MVASIIGMALKEDGQRAHRLDDVGDGDRAGSGTCGDDQVRRAPLFERHGSPRHAHSSYANPSTVGKGGPGFAKK